ncbi:MAG: PilN domain-containing protein [Acidobacteriota bacterium]|nr:PilN domain-containing protein [Acidobacteriota bacterium]
MKEESKLNLELNLRTRAWGICIEETHLTLTALHNKLNQLSYKDSETLFDYDSVSDEDVQDFIEEFQNRHGVKRGDAFMTIPRSQVQIQVAEFPTEAEENLEEVMSYQLANYFPGALEEMTCFPQIIHKGEQLKVMIVAVRNEVLGHAFGLIRRWNMRLAGLSLSSFALVNGLAKLAPNRFANDRIMVFHFGKGTLETIGINRGKLTSSSLIHYDPEEGIQDAVSSLEQAFSEARMDPNEIDHYLASGIPDEDSLLYLKEEIGIPFEEWTDTQDQPVPPEGLTGFGAAVCAVHDKVNLELNMLPEKQRSHRRRLPLILATVAISILALVFVYLEASEYINLSDQETRLQAQYQQYSSRMNEIASARSKLENLQSELADFDRYQQSELLYIMLETLTEQLEDDTYLTNLQIKKGTDLQLQGESDNAFEVQRRLTAIPWLKDVKPSNAITSRKNRDGKSKARFIYKAKIDLEALREEI